MPKHSELLRLLTAGSLVAAGCAPEAKTPEEPQPVGPEATVPTPSPTPTSEPTQIPTLTPTLTRTPTETMTPTPTLETLPTTCLDPEVNQQVVDQFLQDFGFRSLEDALKDRAYFTGYAGFENGPSWYRIYDLKVLGGYRFSLADQPRFGRDDYAHCILGASPHMGGILAPIIIGVENNGQWSQTVLIRQSNNPLVVGKKIDLHGPEDTDRWIEEMRGENIHPLIVARFSQPGWERDPLWHRGYDEVLPLLENPDGYIMKYTRIPTTIAPSASFPEGMPGGLSTMIQEFNLQPGGDIGLFAFQITVEE